MLPLTIDSDNPGREIMGPMAAIIIGGLVSSTILARLVTPVMYKLLPPKLEDACDCAPAVAPALAPAS